MWFTYSAGVGRTGTYISVDRLLQHMQDHDDIDIFNLVLELREYRCRMVQTEVGSLQRIHMCTCHITCGYWCVHVTLHVDTSVYMSHYMWILVCTCHIICRY